MRDPIEELKSFNDGPTGGLPVNPLSPAEVRRAGDRLRRRRNAGAAVAAVAALAVIATPFALLTGGDGKDAGDPAPVAPSPSAGDWLTTIPDGFPIASGLGTNPEDGSKPTLGEGDNGGPGGITLCGEDVWPVDHLDRVWAELLPPAGYRGRDLVLFESDTAARQALDDLAARVDGCESETVFSERAGSDQLLLHTRYDDDGLGDQTVRFATYWDEGIDTDAYQLIRVGNAVALTTLGGEGSEETVGGDIGRLDDMAPLLVEAMAVFDGSDDETGDLESMLLTERETTMGDQSGEAWYEVDQTFAGESTMHLIPCVSYLQDLGATATATRLFGVGGVDPTGEDPAPTWQPTSGLATTVGEFPTKADATAAWQSLFTALDECDTAEFVDSTARTSTTGAQPVGVDQDGAVAFAMTFSGEGGLHWWLEVGIAHEDNRVVVLATVKHMPIDLEPSAGPNSAIELMTANAAASLEPSSPEVDPGGTANGGPTGGTDQPVTDNEPVCTADHLEVSVRYLEGGAGHLYDEIRFTNTSDETCVVFGQTAITVVGDKASPTNVSDEGPMVGIPPGGFASTVTDHSNPDNYDAAACGPEDPVVWQIEIPGGTGDLLEIEGAGYGKACTTINTVQIQPWQAGSSRE